MDKQRKAEWTAALRSGNYEQGAGALRPVDDNYCCLGVLCDLYAKATGEAWGKDDGDESLGQMHNQDSSLPAEVAKWADLQRGEMLSTGTKDGESIACDVRAKHTTLDEDGDKVNCTTLAEMNDRGVNFADIADVIEAQL